MADGFRDNRLMPPEICPNCGAEVPRKARACPECGADEETGWSDDTTQYAPLDLPDEEFDYDDYARKEFGRSPKPHGISWFWWVVAGMLLLALLWMFVR